MLTNSSGWVTCGMWPAPGVLDALRLRQQPRQVLEHRLEDRWALAAGGDQDRACVPREGGLVNGPRVRRQLLVEVGRRVVDHRRPHLLGQLGPGAGPERHVIDEPLRGAGVVARADQVQHHPERRVRATLGQRPPQGRLVHDDAAEQVRPRRCELQRDDGPDRVPDHPRGRGVQRLDQCRQVGDVLGERALSRRPLALTVPPSVVADHPVMYGQAGDDRVPVVVRTPRPVHEHEGLALAGVLVGDPDAVDLRAVHPGTTLLVLMAWLLSSDELPSASSGGKVRRIGRPTHPAPGRRLAGALRRPQRTALSGPISRPSR